MMVEERDFNLVKRISLIAVFSRCDILNQFLHRRTVGRFGGKIGEHAASSSVSEGREEIIKDVVECGVLVVGLFLLGW
ncbi:hypothetical protein ACFFQF_22080 [Haladaptatus pallidirubidus]|uniref:hypothetical protein n=1 Tax=Haladaptatus pallidirubidus TaxID=1008152 RepID=UPI0035EA54D7